jgi:hypothetical protein
MKPTRRQAAIGALSLLVGTTMSTVSEAHLGELHPILDTVVGPAG